MEIDVNSALQATENLKLVHQRLEVLKNLGLGYLTLGEETPSLSGGEAQRLKLASEMGKGQSDSVFIFDEPTIGLHPLDVQTLLGVFQALVDNGATVLVIEHDLDVIRNADYMIDMGPAAERKAAEWLRSERRSRWHKTKTVLRGNICDKANGVPRSRRGDEAMKEKVKVTGVPETMIQTLYARAKETGKKNPKIRDEMAVEVVSQLDYDFSKADQDKTMGYGVIARTIVLDEMVGQYLSTHKNTVVVNIACGMDTRCYRMKGKYLRWYNVDLPETMEIRSRFFTENGPVYQIARSAMDETYVDEITYNGEDVLVIIEGLSMYLNESDVRQIFSIIQKSFQKATVLIEAMSPFVVQHVKEKSIEGSNAKFTWGVKNGKELQQLLTSFTYKKEVSLVEGMKKMMPVYHVLGLIPAVRNISNKIIVMEKN